MLVDPVELNLELFGGEADGAEHTEAAGLAHGDDNIAAMGEGKDRQIDAELVTEGGMHAFSLGTIAKRTTETCSSLGDAGVSRARPRQPLAELRTSTVVENLITVFRKSY